MTVSELLKVLKLTSIDIFELNGTPTPLSIIMRSYGTATVKEVDVITYIDKLTEEDIVFKQIIDDFENILDTINVEQQIPDRGLLLKVKLNIIIKEDIAI